ncbi:DUF6491 family protein [Iodidimonas sp. SYSU 1G8]|uniref:DUF6491 family protein n=1 Tax=Iodidimonas sp. SYSU 1G8 TaxID=3133967 RepID=UPI0031FE8674
MQQRPSVATRVIAAVMAVAVVAGIGAAMNQVHAAPADSISFANFGAIRDWKAEGSGAMIIETTSGDKYRATFMNRCSSLPYSETVGFVTSPSGSLDKFGAVLVRDQKCQIRSLERLG